MSADFWDRIRHAVVGVRAGGRTGSGWIATESGLVVTNAHVVGHASFVELSDADERRVRGKVVYVDVRRDVAFLAPAERVGGAPLPLGSSDRSVPGQTVLALGHPLGLSYTLTRGVLSAVDRARNGITFLQTDAAIHPGNSGGPLIDERGHVLGVCTAIVGGSDTLGLAIPVHELAAALAQHDRPLGELVMLAPTYRCRRCETAYDPAESQCSECGAMLGFLDAMDMAAQQVSFIRAERIVAAALERLRLGPLERMGPGAYDIANDRTPLEVAMREDGFEVIAQTRIAGLPRAGFAELYRFLLSASDASSGGAAVGIEGEAIVVSLREPSGLLVEDTLLDDLREMVRFAGSLREVLESTFDAPPPPVRQ